MIKVRIAIGAKTTDATIDRGQWGVEGDSEMAHYLNRLYYPPSPRDDPNYYIPDKDHAAAQAVLADFAGSYILEETAPKFNPRRIY